MDADTTPTPTPNPRRRGRLVAAALAASAVALAIPAGGAFAGSDDSAGTSSSAKPAQRDGHRGDCPKDKDRGGDSSGTSFDSSTEL
jgi:hypothetical protein